MSAAAFGFFTLAATAVGQEAGGVTDASGTPNAPPPGFYADPPEAGSGAPPFLSPLSVLSADSGSEMIGLPESGSTPVGDGVFDDGGYRGSRVSVFPALPGETGGGATPEAGSTTAGGRPPAGTALLAPLPAGTGGDPPAANGGDAADMGDGADGPAATPPRPRPAGPGAPGVAPTPDVPPPAGAPRPADPSTAGALRRPGRSRDALPAVLAGIAALAAGLLAGYLLGTGGRAEKLRKGLEPRQLDLAGEVAEAADSLRAAARRGETDRLAACTDRLRERAGRVRVLLDDATAAAMTDLVTAAEADPTKNPAALEAAYEQLVRALRAGVRA